MKRKEFLLEGATAVAGSILPVSVSADVGRKKVIRFAHFTDMHIKPGKIPEAGVAKALHHVQLLKKPVEFIINGGDAIMDALEADKPTTKAQWDILKATLQRENQLPIKHVIGNHDVWGWFEKERKAENDSMYGKAWAVEELEMKKRYYSFSKGAWHFMILDSTQLNPAGGYIAQLDIEQMDWLQKELKSVPAEKFICLVSHIPILSICAGLFFNKTETNGDLLVKRNLMHTDFFTLKKLFRQYRNIRVCISGHIHLQEEIEYLGIKYYCNGAISGNWWNGAFQEFEPAYAVMELFDNGDSRRYIIKYQEKEQAGSIN